MKLISRKIWEAVNSSNLHIMHAQCGKFWNFAWEILCEINLENSRSLKNASFYRFSASEFRFWHTLAIKNCNKKNHHNLTLEPQKYQNSNSWNLCNPKNCFHVKSVDAEKFCTFHTVHISIFPISRFLAYPRKWTGAWHIWK